MESQAAQKLRNVLSQFTGSEEYWPCRIYPAVQYTSGVHYLAEEAGAYWLIDEIAMNVGFSQNTALAQESFQVWTLDIRPNRSAWLRVEDGNGKEIYKMRIPFTDFPLQSITLYLSNNVLMLPTEY